MSGGAKESKELRRSAGVVVVRRAAAGYRYLLLRAYNYWDFPKGEVQAGESPVAAAVREVREETGLADLEFRWGERYVETAPYRGNKVARYYLASSPAGDVRLGVNPALGKAEHHEFRWVAYPAASRLLGPRVRKVLQWADAVLDSER